MKYMFASDVHGSAYYCRKMLETYKKEQAERLVLLGDLLYHGPRNDLPKEYAPKEVIKMLNGMKQEIYAVRGNCEAEVDQMVLEFPVMADYCILAIDGLTFYATHGHVYNENNLPPFCPGDILIHGHTHVLKAEQRENYILLNPGSVSIPKEGNPPTYAVLEDKVFTIKDFDGNIKKEYHQDGYYITDVTVGSSMMEFNLSEKNGNAYTVKNKDNIMNNKKTSADLVSVEQTSTTRQGVIVKLVFTDKPEADEPLILTAKIKNGSENIVQVEVDKSQLGNVYYVYARGGLDSVWTDPAQAVLQADSRTGVVLNRAQQYVWERGNMKTQLTLNTEDVPEIIRSGSWDKDKLQEGLGDSGTVIDLTGCSLENVLYEISAQRAVIAKTGADTSVVIVGYDAYNTWLLNPATGEVSPYGMNDSTALFQQAGNVFISYLDNQK
jgi:putative phosphoesterase